MDVNVPMYAAGQPHTHKEACTWIMQEIATGHISAAIDVEIVQEILYRYGALKRWDLAVSMATDVLEIVPSVFPITPAEARLSVVLFERYAKGGVTARDVIHAAVMQNNSIQKIISTDEHFDQVEGLTRFNPLKLFEGKKTS
jgi:predicted nucleic acid-binding protein